MNQKVGQLTLCPFAVDKPAASRLVLNRPLRLTCQKSGAGDRCLIDGRGNHFRIQGPNAQIILEGFTFQSATECAVRVAPTATKPQLIQGCEFLG